MKLGAILLASAAFLAAGCTANPQTNREIECAAGIFGGAAVGGLLGNQVGKGRGREVATAAGAGAGAVAGTQTPACR